MSKIYYGPQTKSALQNFPFSFRKTSRELIICVVQIKKACAIAHGKANDLPKPTVLAISKACDEILLGKMNNQFLLPAFQGGAGTSNHMNVNEVIASRATEILKFQKQNILVHPNDHVNLSHSTNDVMHTALKLTAFGLSHKVINTIQTLINSLSKKSGEFKNLPKLGRTHLQDAVPTTLGAEFQAWTEVLKRRLTNLKTATNQLLEQNLGGGAIGTSINASKKYLNLLYKELQNITQIKVKRAKNLMSQTGSDGDLLELSQSLTAFCMDLSKIANDLRLLSSGPRGGFSEIILPELQPGSSMMPGKINPILPEAINQLYFLVSGNNLTIEHACHASQLELGAMMPIISDRIIESLKLSQEVINVFEKKCIKGIKANKAKIKEHLDSSTAYATLLSPKLGYNTVTNMVKLAIKNEKSLKETILDEKLLSEKDFLNLTK